MCLTFLVKHILFVVNLIFVLIAFAIIGVGSYALHYVNNNEFLANRTTITQDSDGVWHDTNFDALTFFCIAIIVVGVVIFLISFCGCCGSISENRCLLILYAILMFLFAGVSILILITSTSILREAKFLIGDTMRDTFYSAKDPVMDETIHAIQYSLQCCGPNGPLDDYYNEHNVGLIDELLDYIFENRLNITGIGYVSPSCCSTFDLRSFVDNPEEYIQDGFVCTADDVFMEGCVDRILSYVETVSKYVTYIIGGIAGFEVLAFIFATYMCCVISEKNKKRRRGY